MNQAIIRVYGRGYRVIDSIIYNPAGRVVKPRLHKSNGRRKKGWYLYFGCKLSVRGKTRKVHIAVHRFVAYQKYDGKLFEKGMAVRHLDGNSLNNLAENIGMGTLSQNMMDRPLEDRLIHARIAASYNTKHKAPEIVAFYRETRSYKQTCRAFGIGKSTLHYILHNRAA